MKNLMTWFCSIALGGMLVLTFAPALASAQDETPATPAAAPAKVMCDQAHCMAPGAYGHPPMHRGCACILRALLGLLVIIHIMLAVWVYTDIRKRGEGHGLFIILALLAGIPGTILYALVRIGDKKS